MTLTVEQAALRHARQLCLGHRDALLDALSDLDQRSLAAEKWIDLRRIRDEFTHDYPETTGERFARLQLATMNHSRHPAAITNRKIRIALLGCGDGASGRN